MEVEKMISSMGSATNYKNDDDDVDFPLPGFRFHPTDEELVGFYLRRMIEKKPLPIQLINQVDIYKYDPWDLPSMFRLLAYFFFFLMSDNRMLVCLLKYYEIEHINLPS